MNWGSASQFFEMGGYGLYVWGSYAVMFAAIVFELMLLATRRRSLGQKAAGDKS